MDNLFIFPKQMTFSLFFPFYLMSLHTDDIRLTLQLSRKWHMSASYTRNNNRPCRWPFHQLIEMLLTTSPRKTGNATHTAHEHQAISTIQWASSQRCCGVLHWQKANPLNLVDNLVSDHHHLLSLSLKKMYSYFSPKFGLLLSWTVETN